MTLSAGEIALVIARCRSAGLEPPIRLRPGAVLIGDAGDRWLVRADGELDGVLLLPGGHPRPGYAHCTASTVSAGGQR